MSTITRARVKRTLNVVEFVAIVDLLVVACGALGIYGAMGGLVYVTDDQPPPDEEQESDRSASRLRRAQAAAGDLARMGIDPRSLGLEDSSDVTPSEAPRSQEPDAESGPRVRPWSSCGPRRPRRRGAGAGAPASCPSSDRAPAALRTPMSAEVAEDRTRRVSRVEQLLSRAHADQPVPRETSRLFRAVARGLVTVDAALSAQEERDLLDAVRSRQGDRRTVAFVSGQGGVGCTTLAVATGTTLMALREDRIGRGRRPVRDALAR